MNQFTTLQLEVMRQAIRNAATTIEMVLGDALTPLEERENLSELLWLTPSARQIANATNKPLMDDYHAMVDACCMINAELAHRRGELRQNDSETVC